MKGAVAEWAVLAVVGVWAGIGLTGVAVAQQNRPASGGNPAAGNPLDALPQINAPQKAPNVTVQVEQQTPQLQQLLATHITPATFKVEGVKSIPFDEVVKKFAPLANHDITIGQLIETANEVTKLYQERGYALSFAFVPAQDFAGGVVRITVVEGYVKDVKVTGKPGKLEDKMRSIAAHIVEDRPLRTATFQRYINVLGLLPGLKVKANVAPPTNTDGATTLELDATQKPYDISTGIDFNHPGVQGLLTLTENGLTPFGEQLSVSALLPKGRDNVTYLAAHAAVPIASDGLIAKVDASHYRGNPTDNPGLPGSVERTVISDKITGALSYPLLLSNTRSVVGTVSAYATHDEDRYHNTLNGLQYGLKSQVRVVQLQADYTDVQTGQVRKASIAVAKAFNVLGASKSADTNIPGLTLQNPASLNFVRTNASFSQTNDWPMGFGTAVAVIGQYSPVSLPTSEQISFGAQRFAAGYEPGEASGDSGWAYSLELNRPLKIGKVWLQTLTPYVSFDMARVYLHAGTPSPSRLSSASIGFRLSDGRYYSVDLSVAKALADAPVESASRSPRFNATFSYQLN
ncbi:hemolysin activation/secretion protein [Paraburkholderia bannensis]|uniref:Hemolysin activation/secretion protein n=1 Tax=Paraburkholderia bannensis TaxID=765414 RepID=A0A7W9WSR8_9BURK|nr:MULTISPECIES: ShlB/FhaC/HecB family hemolysin secretion/activation protein [Paraburkholderia]MBB3259564.1 hemolysin activation/secretion protein [Paraburkholderia sp. WP4_3_2]MBB6104580.1 hemolysin activation/secretion protein [Paraburkholderia bannensis]